MQKHNSDVLIRSHRRISVFSSVRLEATIIIRRRSYGGDLRASSGRPAENHYADGLFSTRKITPTSTAPVSAPHCRKYIMIMSALLGSGQRSVLHSANVNAAIPRYCLPVRRDDRFITVMKAFSWRIFGIEGCLRSGHRSKHGVARIIRFELAILKRPGVTSPNKKAPLQNNTFKP